MNGLSVSMSSLIVFTFFFNESHMHKYCAAMYKLNEREESSRRGEEGKRSSLNEPKELKEFIARSDREGNSMTPDRGLVFRGLNHCKQD